ncbi:MAG: class I SAM-dependent methyltransferase [Antricoccus sp.]
MSKAIFEVIDVPSLRHEYVQTIDVWYRRLEDNLEAAIRVLGIEVARVRRLYLIGSPLAFAENRMGVDQVLGTRVE